MPNKKRASRKSKKRRHECGINGLCLHGAFSRKSDAETKARKVRGAFVVRKFAKWGKGERGYRYMVCTSDKSGVPF